MNVDALYALLRHAHPDDEIIIDVEGMEEMVCFGLEIDERDGRVVIKACRFEDLDHMEQEEADDELPFEPDDKDECGESSDGGPSCAIPEKPSSKAPEAKEA